MHFAFLLCLTPSPSAFSLLLLPSNFNFDIRYSLFFIQNPFRIFGHQFTKLKTMSKNDLEDRLISFAIRAVRLAEQLPKTIIGNRLNDQLTRASSSAPLNYGEAQSAESRKDFVHKSKVVLKELRESNVALKMIDGLKLAKDTLELATLLSEANELIAIFVTSVNTARRNDQKK